MEPRAGHVWVASEGDNVYVQVEGRATHLHGQSLRDFADAMVEQGHRDFLIDLGPCSSMDSTFLGVLVGISKKASTGGDGKVALCRMTPRHLELFQTLGVDRFFCLQTDDASEHRGLAELPSQQCADIVLQAHQALVEADERNRLRFKDVLEYLQQDLGRKLPSASRPEPHQRWKH